ncbi:MAG: YihY/virulence factor BrkB family protein [Pseudomonadota bacterium]
MRLLRLLYRVPLDAFYRFNADDGWAIASHIALSTLMSLFPFLILCTALAGFFGSKDLADEVARILLEAWPTQVATPIAAEIHNVLTAARGDLLTIGALLAVYFSSSGIESLRIGLNRAYNTSETRHWYWLRLESIGYVILGAVGMLVMAFMIVLAPLIFATAVRHAPLLEPLWPMLNFLRFAIASAVLIIALFIVHKWLPSGHRSLLDILPGIGATLAMWLIAGKAFGDYLAEFAKNYVTTYAGLASVMVALVFLYMVASIFIYGGELNATISEHRKERRRRKSGAV